MDLAKNLGIIIRRLRNLRGVSQERMANEAGVDRRYVCDVEAGKRNISVDVLARFAAFFDVTPGRLLDMAQTVEQPPMSLEALKDILCDRGAEDAIVLEQPDYLSAIVGISEDGRVVYSYSLMVEYLMITDGMEAEEAVEFIDFNTIRALPYMGEKSPVILYDLQS